MIFSPLFLRLAPYGVAVLLVIGAGVYVHQRAYNRGQAEIQAKWDKQKAIQELAYQERERKVAKLENELDLANHRIAQELLPRLKAADDYGKRMAGRLRSYYADQAKLPEATESSEGNAGTLGDGSDTGIVDHLVGQFIASCKADFAKLTAWQTYWDSIPKEMKQE